MVDRELLTFGGDCGGEALDEVCMANISSLTDDLAWHEPAITSGPLSLPSPRKGMAAIFKGGVVYLYSGHTASASGEYEASDEMFAVRVHDGALDVRVVEQQGAFRPEPRAGAVLQHYSEDAFFMFGGFAADGRALNDGWTFTVAKSRWTCVYNGHPELALPTGALCCLQNRKLVAINAAAGSPKLDVATSLDLEAVAAEYEFVPRMKTQAAAMLTQLQAWTAKQERGLAHNVEDLQGDFTKLLETMAALYDVRVADNSKELLIDQLRELFTDLAAYKVNTKKSLEQLDAVQAQLERVKASAPAVKEAVVPAQKQEGKRIRDDIQAFTDRVNAYARDFRKFPFLTYATGPAASYEAMDKEVGHCTCMCVWHAECYVMAIYGRIVTSSSYRVVTIAQA